MKKRLSSFSIHQSSKVIAFAVMLVSFVVCIPLGLYAMIHDHNILGGLLMALGLPLLVFLLKYILYAIIFFLFNTAAGFVGGIEFEVEDAEK